MYMYVWIAWGLLCLKRVYHVTWMTAIGGLFISVSCHITLKFSVICSNSTQGSLFKQCSLNKNLFIAMASSSIDPNHEIKNDSASSVNFSVFAHKEQYIL